MKTINELQIMKKTITDEIERLKIIKSAVEFSNDNSESEFFDSTIIFNQLTDINISIYSFTECLDVINYKIANKE